MKKPFPVGIYQFLLLFLIVFVIFAFTIIPLSDKFQFSFASGIALMFLTLLGVMILLTFLINRVRGTVVKPNIRLRKLDMPPIAWSICLLLVYSSLFFFPIFSYFGNLLSAIFSSSWLMVFATVLLAPIAEEIMFREILLRGLLNTYRPAIAIVTSSLLFAIYHFSWIQGLNAFILGVVLGYVYYQTKNISQVIIIHILNNVWGLIVAMVANKISIAFQLPIVATLCLISIPFIFLLYKQLNKSLK